MSLVEINPANQKVNLGGQSVQLREATAHQLRLASVFADATGKEALSARYCSIADRLGDDGHAGDLGDETLLQILIEPTFQF